MVVKKGRALHFVFKVADRTEAAKFFRDILGMKALRHEEFKEGCSAQCNGPYDDRWSKTMVGYGPEDDHFVMELTYNYNVSSYALGNDFLGITIKSREAIERAKAANWPISQEGGINVVTAPGGYKFFLLDEPQTQDKDPVQKVTLASSNLVETIKYWNDTIGLKIYARDDKSILFGYEDNQTKVEFKDIGQQVEHQTSYGRIAFSVPHEELAVIDDAIKKSNRYKILTSLIDLETPGKANVTVEILADPDGHEICFVNDEGFRELSQVESNADTELDKYIKKDEARKKTAVQS